MSLCLRNISNKFTPFVNTHKRVTKIDRHLPKHVKSSLFLEEFLNIPTATYETINYGKRSLNPVLYSVDHYAPIIYFNVYTKQSSKLNKKNDWSEQQLTCMQEQRKRNIQTDNAINVNESTCNNNFQLLESNISYSSPYVNKSCPSHNQRLSISKNLVKSLCAEEQTVFCTKHVPNLQNADDKESSNEYKPTEEQLKYILEVLKTDLPQMFVKTLDYRIYTQDMVFVNNFKGVVITGVHNYLKQVLMLRVLGHIKYAYIKFEILKITMHPEDSSIKVRWRIVGISGTRIFLTFWTFKSWNIQQSASQGSESWYDGFSTFYVNNDGKVFRHVADKMMPDQSNIMEKLKTPIAAKLALFLPLLDLNTCQYIQSCSNNELK